VIRMSYHTVEVTELPEDREEDFQLEIKTSDSLLGIQMSEDEVLGLGQMLVDSAQGDMESFDGAHADEIAEEVLD